MTPSRTFCPRLHSRLLILAGLLIWAGCRQSNAPTTAYADQSFWQEDHKPFPVGTTPEENEVRSIAVDRTGTVWVATAAGLFQKPAGDSFWTALQTEADKGPAFSVAVDSNSVVWLGSWNGLFRIKAGKPEKVAGPIAPISAICTAQEGVYVLGPNGVWLVSDKGVTKKNYAIARSIRDVISDGKGGIWVASDVGAYHCSHHRN